MSSRAKSDLVVGGAFAIFVMFVLVPVAIARLVDNSAWLGMWLFPIVLVGLVLAFGIAWIGSKVVK